jgi:hypothetical protein
MIDQNMKTPNEKHPNYNNNLLEENRDVFKPDFKRDSRGRYFMQLPGYGKWMVGNEPGSKIISQGSEDEGGGPATDFGSLRTGTLNVDTVLSIGDTITMNGESGCILIGDPDMGATRPWISLCRDGIVGHSANETTFGFFLEKTDEVWDETTGEVLDKGDVLIGGLGSDQYIIWNDSDGILRVEGTIYASAGEIGGWTIDTCLISAYEYTDGSGTKIELCPGNPGHIQVAYSPTNTFSTGGDVYMVQMTQGSTADPGGVPIPRLDVYRDGVKRAMLNSSGLYFFEPDGTTIATSILSGATNEEIFNNVQVNAGDIEGVVRLNNAQTIDDVTTHVITLNANPHETDMEQLEDQKNYMSRIDATIEDTANPTYIGYIWTTRLQATLPGSTGVVLNYGGIRGYNASGNLTFDLDAATGNFYFGDYYGGGNSVAWDGSTLAVKGTIRALAGYIGGNNDGWRIESNVLQAWSGSGGTGTKLIELSSAGPHIQCLNGTSHYVQMTPASNDPRFDVFYGGIRRTRLNKDGLTFWNSSGTITCSFNQSTNTLGFYSSGVQRASLRGTYGKNGGIYCSGDIYIPNNRSFWIEGTSGQYAGMSQVGGSLWLTCGSAATFYIFNTGQTSQMLGISSAAMVIGGGSYSSMHLIPYGSGSATLGNPSHKWERVNTNNVESNGYYLDLLCGSGYNMGFYIGSSQRAFLNSSQFYHYGNVVAGNSLEQNGGGIRIGSTWFYVYNSTTLGVKILASGPPS